jgi:chromate reductase, NAD(P)H dehydrogenase (quinone)
LTTVPSGREGEVPVRRAFTGVELREPGAQLRLPWRRDVNALVCVLSGVGTGGTIRVEWPVISPATPSTPEVRVLVFSASLRAQSMNTRLATLAAHTLAAVGATVDLAAMREFDCPSYDGDVQELEGYPDGVERFRRRVEAAHAFVISSPEYNFSVPGLLKNLIDWASRYQPQPFKDKHALLLSASPSMAGGNRGLWALRMPLEHLGVHVYPDMFSLAQAHHAFDDHGHIADAQLQTWFNRTITDFLALAEAAVHYPCAKSAWIEFLGEHSDPALDRVQE